MMVIVGVSRDMMDTEGRNVFASKFGNTSDKYISEVTPKLFNARDYVQDFEAYRVLIAPTQHNCRYNTYDVFVVSSRQMTIFIFRHISTSQRIHLSLSIHTP